MLIISVICTFLMLNKLMEKVKRNPIVIYRSDVATKVTEIPFPAVTYCADLQPVNEVYNFSYIEDLINFYGPLDEEE